MTDFDDQAVMGLMSGGPLDVLVTHQGPAAVQRTTARPCSTRCWSTKITAIGNTTVVPLCDVVFRLVPLPHDYYPVETNRLQ